MSGAGLSAEDLALVALLLEEEGIEPVAPDVIPPRRPGERVPLTFSQKRLWFLEQLEPETRIYNDVFAHRVLGGLDLAALEEAVNGVVARHEALRTVFVEEDGEPVQRVLPELRIPLDFRDLTGLPEEERLAEARRIADRTTYAPFDLTTGPLLRPTVLRLGEGDHVFLLPVHHIVTDGWSQRIFYRELAALYDAFREGRPSPLPPPPLQYGDYAVWQQAHLAGGALERQLAYWMERLRGAPTLLELPTGRVRPAEQTYRGAAYDFAVPRPVGEGLHALAQAEGATLFMLLVAALGTLLGRYAGEEDVVIGSPIANRTRPELEQVVGLFANTLAIRVDLSGDPPFRALLRRVRDEVFEDFANQDLPFEKIVEEMRIERSLSYNPLYQVLFALQNVPRSRERLAGLTPHSLDEEHRKAKLDLALTMLDVDREVFGGWEYSTELFDRDTVARLTDHFVTLLRGIVEDPDRRLSGLPLVTPEERTRVLHTWNAAARDEPWEGPVHERFAARAALHPDAPAVLHDGAVLGYGELARRGARLARHLRARGVGPETRVGVCLERGPDTLVALLGVLGAGGAYVPLDPAYPRDRLAFLAEDSGAALALTHARHFADLPPELAAAAVFLDADAERITAEPDGWPGGGVHPENAAYVVYTSGSTGRPKGVVVPHGALAAFTRIARDAYGIGPGDAVLQFASLAFDASVEEIWPALTSGARLVLRTEEMLDSPAAFLERCREWGITVLDLPTAYWHELAAGVEEDGALELPAALRLVIIGGERALPERLHAWRARCGERVRLVNTYGPTETTVVATLADVAAAPPEAGAPLRHVPIGRPVRNARAYVLDPRGEPAPIGVPGELYLGGGGVARGYLGRPELTAERFLPDPFAGEPGARVYRTGDRVRWLPDGTLEFVGRTDQQVKIRGFRVELGEVEAAIHAHPGVEDAVVVARAEAGGSQRLVAYVVPEAGAALPVAELRAALRARLPGYMVPAAWVTLDALPLTRSGKVDRRALPAPDMAPREAPAGPAEPRSDAERAIAEAWREVLGIEEVGLDDNFFDVGGHSLLLARLRARLEGRFPGRVSVVVLFRYPTVRSLAEHLAGEEGAAPPAPETDEAGAEARRAALRRRRELRGGGEG